MRAAEIRIFDEGVVLDGFLGLIPLLKIILINIKNIRICGL